MRMSRLKWGTTIAFLVLAPIFLSGCLIAEGGFQGEIYLEPGTTIPLHLGVGGCCYFILPLSTPTLWSLSPYDAARIDPLSGVLTIDGDAEHGSSFTVTGGTATAVVYVFDPEKNPLVKNWYEVGQFSCEGGVETIPEYEIQEVIFTPAGDFTVTWYPFELYKDYWGTYTFDHETGALVMTIESGNHIPDNFDGEGTATVNEEGDLVLSDIWFGTASAIFGETPPATETGCGHRLTPRVL